MRSRYANGKVKRFVKDLQELQELFGYMKGSFTGANERVRGKIEAANHGTHSHPRAEQSGRLELAEWLVDPGNPLTARVVANRIWHHLFGTGLVRTVDDFGRQGERPSHPELLDYLAARFIAVNWSFKRMIREIVLSHTYQLSTENRDEAFRVDPENRLLWRMNRRRLAVEVWRDAMLTAAQTLDEQVGGPSSDLARPDNRRRTLYGSVSRHELNSLLRLFDFPDPNLTADERPTTTVPLQQLFVLNSEFMVRNAKALVARLVAATIGIEVPFNHCIVGRTAFTHKAGIHTKAIINDPHSYEVLEPEDFGLERAVLVAHRLAGHNAVGARARALGLSLSPGDLRHATATVKAMADQRKLTDDDVNDVLLMMAERRAAG
jgi:hypothetical protein